MKFIDFDALEKNVLYLKKTASPAKLCAVLKNDAYGHGLEHIAVRIAPHADMFAVGSVAEAEKISFLNKDILILLPQNKRNALRAVMGNFFLTVDSFETLETLYEVAAELGVSARVHVKIDSGMSRLGFTYGDMPRLIARLRAPCFRVEGIFSHFYGESRVECEAQYAYFLRCLQPFGEAFPNAIRHIANTSATLLFPEYRMDMVRVGLGLFGYGDNLRPVKSVCADVIAVRQVKKGSVVGYGAKYIAPSDSYIAVLNAGYATGLPRTLVGSRIKIGEKFFPIAAICMAMTLICADETVRVGDVAWLLGNGVNIANDKVIIYELLCNLQ